MLPILTAIGAGLSALSALKNLTTGSKAAAAPTTTTTNNPAVTNLSTNNTAGKSSGANGTAATGGEIQDRFLKLLVTQMKNQDPLNPMDNAQVTTQLAQISTVGGLDKLNATISGLANSMLATQSAQASAMIGREVFAAGSTMTLANGKATGGLELKQDADRVFVSITNAAGAIVRTLDLGAAKAGMSGFQWDGKTDNGDNAPNGTYKFNLTAVKGNSTISVESIAAGRVGGVSLNNGVKLNLEDGTEIGMSDVKRII